MIGITPGFEATALMLCQSLAESGPVTVDEFDDAWTPAGETYRDELFNGGLIAIEQPSIADGDGPPTISLTAAGVGLVADQAAPAPGSAPQP